MEYHFLPLRFLDIPDIIFRACCAASSAFWKSALSGREIPRLAIELPTSTSARLANFIPAGSTGWSDFCLETLSLPVGRFNAALVELAKVVPALMTFFPP